MTWLTLLLLALGLAIMFVRHRSSQATVLVPVEHQAAGPAGELRAVEYFWRPG